MYYADIEANKILPNKEEKGYAESENQKQLFADVFEYSPFWKYCKHQWKISVLQSHFNAISGLQLQQVFNRYFPVKFAKFLRTNFFLQNTCGSCFSKINLDRSYKGGYTLLVKYIPLFDKSYFFCWFRMSPAVFEEF